MPIWLTAEIIIAISSILIALCALVTTIWQGMITRKHNKLSVRPIISVYVIVSGDNTLGLKIVNQGLGPAIITSAFIKKNGFQFRLDDRKYLSLFPELTDNHFQFGLGGMQGSLVPLQPHWLISTEVHNDLNIKKSLVSALNKIELEFEYESIYRDKFPPFKQTIDFGD
ncbi:hypothetical protein [Shewanella litoralis]|uniref:Uncharacterized protein n=1 Tax=Shewanella litoralis TaxID=2282700 RepID=A0ABQ2R4U4_9GAMM|nr:hypothetical protein [Shewanella litoralis]GGQ13875.1 hypothetical protein GCM10009411_13050 [Shewanella litoralis]